MNTESRPYAARLEIDYPARELDRLSTALRFLYVIPIGIILALVMEGFGQTRGESRGLFGGLVFATMLMLVVRQRYPRWWFDFMLQLSRFSTRVAAYALLLTDVYPSTEDEQSVHLELDYPDAKKLNRWLPLVKWFLAIPHYFALFFLGIAAMLVTILEWFAILFNGRYNRELFEFVVGVLRWGLRVQAYAFLMLTDEYPPFSLRPRP